LVVDAFRPKSRAAVNESAAPSTGRLVRNYLPISNQEAELASSYSPA
jgi:hypothetical protein